MTQLTDVSQYPAGNKVLKRLTFEYPAGNTVLKHLTFECPAGYRRKQHDFTEPHEKNNKSLYKSFAIPS